MYRKGHRFESCRVRHFLIIGRSIYMKLTESANKYRTDKGTTAFESHGYIEVVDSYKVTYLFTCIKELPIIRSY